MPGAVLRHPPQRPDAREQQEQQGHDRWRPTARCGAASDAAWRSAGWPTGMWGQHQRGQQPPHRAEHRQRHQQRLRVQEVGQHQEEAEEEHDEGVAARAQLECLQCHQHHRERHARLLAEQAAVAPEGGGGGQSEHRQQHPAPGQGVPGSPPAAPAMPAPRPSAACTTTAGATRGAARSTRSPPAGTACRGSRAASAAGPARLCVRAWGRCRPGSLPQRQQFEAGPPVNLSLVRAALGAGQAQAVGQAELVGAHDPSRPAATAAPRVRAGRRHASRTTADDGPRCWCRGSAGRPPNRAAWRPSSRRSSSAGRRGGSCAPLRSRRRRHGGSAALRRRRLRPPAAVRSDAPAAGRRGTASPAARPSRRGTGRAETVVDTASVGSRCRPRDGSSKAMWAWTCPPAGHVDPGQAGVWGRVTFQADAMPGAPVGGRGGQHHLDQRRVTREHRLHRLQVQPQPAQRVVGQVHRPPPRCRRAGRSARSRG